MSELDIRIGDCREVMAAMEADSVDAIVTDPPYALTGASRGGGGFMGKTWDAQIPGPEVWAEALRVAKPGAHLVAAGGTRTFHRLVCAIEDAGWEIRDTVCWITGQGFPKSLDISKAIDKAGTAESEDIRAFQQALIAARKSKGLTRAEVSTRVVGTASGATWNWETGLRVPTGDHWNKLVEVLSLPQEFVGLRDAAERAVLAARRGSTKTYDIGAKDEVGPRPPITAPTTDAARQWAGWGTALKPAVEFFTIARKPLAAGTVAANVLAHGTGALNIDGCRVEGGPSSGGSISGSSALGQSSGWNAHTNRTAMIDRTMPLGRWPANLVLAHSDGCREVGTKRVRGSRIEKPSEEFEAFADGGMGGPRGGPRGPRGHGDADGMETVAAWECEPDCPVRLLDEQSRELTSNGQVASYESRPNAVYGDLSGHVFNARQTNSGGASRFFYCAKSSSGERHYAGKNVHSTVKPVDLMRWLCRLVTPPGGLVLDPFAGSGSTGIAALAEGFRFIGIEISPEYATIAKRRIAGPLFSGGDE